MDRFAAARHDRSSPLGGESFTGRASFTEPGIGPTAALSLRVSVIAVTQAVFTHPDTRELYAVVERKATCEIKNGTPETRLQCQPLGGANILSDVAALQRLIGDFNYDSTESKSKKDLRIFIDPENWPAVRNFCVQHISNRDTGVIEADSRREVSEELGEALGKAVNKSGFNVSSLVVVVREGATPSTRLGIAGALTKRVLNICRAEITDEALVRAILANSGQVRDQELASLAERRARAGKKGKATALLAVPLTELDDFCERSASDLTKASLRGCRVSEMVLLAFDRKWGR